MEGGESQLKQYLEVIRRRKGIVALAVIIVLGVVMVASFLQQKVYRASAEVLLQSRQSEFLFDPSTGQRSDPQRIIETEIRVINSEPVRKAVRDQMGFAAVASAKGVAQTDVILVSARSTDAAQASKIANTYASAYIDYRRKQAVDDLLAASGKVQDKITALQKQIDALPSGGRSGDPSSSTRDALTNQVNLFRGTIDKLQVDAELRSGGAQLVTPASTPTSPIVPTPKRNAVLGLVAGLVLGVGLAFLFDFLDDSIKSKDDLERSVGALPTLGLIPAIATWRDRGEALVISRTEPASAAAEAYRTLRTSIQFIGLDRPVRTVQVTSSNASEGKTTTLANLGVALARAGHRVILVCCDLRRPRLNEFFGLPNVVGFTSVLLGDIPLSAALQPVEGEPRLMLLASGPVPPNPSELLTSKRTVELLAAVQANADMVLIDSPPVLPVTDAQVLSARVDATLLVVTARSTTKKEAARSMELLRQVDAPVIGTVLNGLTDEAGYGYAYKYEYYPRDERDVREAARRP